MKPLLTTLLILLLTSCKKEAVQTHKNGNFDIELLFEHDGCKVYRFLDDRTVYFSDCRGKIEHKTTTSTGKTTVTHYHSTLNN